MGTAEVFLARTPAISQVYLQYLTGWSSTGSIISTSLVLLLAAILLAALKTNRVTTELVLMDSCPDIKFPRRSLGHKGRGAIDMVYYKFLLEGSPTTMARSSG
jgi:hypothetical protein